MFFENNLDSLENELYPPKDIKKLVDQPLLSVLDNHPQIKKFIFESQYHPSLLERIIWKYPFHPHSVYLAFFQELILHLDDMNKTYYVPVLFTDLVEYIKIPRKIIEYFEKTPSKRDILFQCINILFTPNYFRLDNINIVHSDFSSFEDQKKAILSFVVAVSRFFYQKFLYSKDIDEISLWIVKNFDIPEKLLNFRSYLSYIDSAFSTPQIFSSELDKFVDNFNYFYARYHNPYQENLMTIDEYSIEYLDNDTFKLSGPEGTLFLDSYEDITNNKIPQLPLFFQKFIFDKKQKLNELFPENSIKILHKNHDVYIDKYYKYTFKIYTERNYSFLDYLMNIIDYLTSKHLENILPNNNYFIRNISLISDWKISSSKLVKNITNTPKLYIMPCIDGHSLYVYIKNKIFSQQDLLIITIELLSALQDAYDVCQFTHYDFHPSNIIMKPCENYIWSWRGYSLEITRNFQPIIIDFGRSRIQDDDKTLAIPWTPINRDYLSIINNPYPAHDIFKILATIHHYSGFGIFANILKDIFKLSWKEISYNYAGALFSLPYIKKYTSIQHRYVIDHIFKEYSLQ